MSIKVFFTQTYVKYKDSCSKTTSKIYFNKDIQCRHYIGLFDGVAKGARADSHCGCFSASLDLSLSHILLIIFCGLIIVHYFFQQVRLSMNIHMDSI